MTRSRCLLIGILVVGFLFLIRSDPMLAQPLSWTKRPSGTLQQLRAVACSSPISWVTVGDAGTILRSTDGGGQWEPVSSPVADDLRGVAFDGSTGIIVGISGVMLKSTDQGASWTNLPRFTTKFLFGVTMSSLAVIAVGEEGTLLHSTDQGTTWHQSGSGFANAYFGVAIVADTVIAGAYGGVIANSLNGGGAWGGQLMGSPPGNAPAFYGVSFATSRNAIMVGAAPGTNAGGIILRSQNLGFTWTRQPTPPVGTLNAVTFVGPDTGFAAGDEGMILATVDTGSHWVQQPSGATVKLNGVSFAGPELGVAVGDSGTILLARPQLPTGIAGETPSMTVQPGRFILEQNYPNPFNPSTTINYTLTTAGRVELRIFDILGREVTKIVDSYQSAGTHSAIFDGRGMSSGVYVYRINSGAYSATRRMILEK